MTIPRLRRLNVNEENPMNFPARYSKNGSLDLLAVLRDVGIAIVALIVFKVAWPFYSVPTGSRGVITQFGRIVGIEGEGLAVLPPWQKLSNFSIRAEKADIE